MSQLRQPSGCDCYRKVIAFIREAPRDYEPGFEDVFVKIVEIASTRQPQPIAALAGVREGAKPAPSKTILMSSGTSHSTCRRRVTRCTIEKPTDAFTSHAGVPLGQGPQGRPPPTHRAALGSALS